MNNKKPLMIIILVFVFLLGGAYVLYTQFGESLAPNQLAVQEEQNQNKTPDTNATAGGEKRFLKKF